MFDMYMGWSNTQVFRFVMVSSASAAALWSKIDVAACTLMLKSFNDINSMWYGPKSYQGICIKLLRIQSPIQCNLMTERVEGWQKYIGRHYRLSGQPRHFVLRPLQPIRESTLTSTFTSRTTNNNPLLLHNTSRWGKFTSSNSGILLPPTHFHDLEWCVSQHCILVLAVQL